MKVAGRKRFCRAVESNGILVAAVVAALAVRVVWAFAAGDAQPFWDADSYITIADNLRAGNGFLWGDSLAGRPPLYPLLVATVRTELAGRDFLLLYLVQAVLGAASVLLFSLSARALAGRAAGGITAVAAAFWPFLIFYTGTVLTETLFVFALSGLCFFVVKLMADIRLRDALAAGLFAGAAYLTRPSILGVVLVLAVVPAARRRFSGRALVAAGVILALAFATVLPWAMRNRRVLGATIFSTTGVGASLYDGLGPGADGSSDMSFLHAMPELVPMGEIERDGYLRAEALEAARKSPRRVLRLAIVKATRLWTPVPSADRFRRPVYVLVSAGAVLPVYLLAIVALLKRTMRWPGLALVLAPPAYFTALHMIFVGSTRYRAPVMPFIIILAATGAVSLLAEGSDAEEGAQEPCLETSQS
ncbi:MAG: glycosyltransferase family 39 protein [Planctomycetota bacterium]